MDGRQGRGRARGRARDDGGDSYSRHRDNQGRPPGAYYDSSRGGNGGGGGYRDSRDSRQSYDSRDSRQSYDSRSGYGSRSGSHHRQHSSSRSSQSSSSSYAAAPPPQQSAWSAPLRHTPAPPPAQSAWGAPPKQPPAQSMSGGRSQYRGGGDGPSRAATDAGTTSGAGNGGGDQQHSGRGGHRGRRDLVPEPTTRLATDTKKGRHGQPVILKTNYFKLETRPEWCIFQYRVDFAPDVDVTNARKKMLHTVLRALNIHGIFDGTVLYSPNRIHPDPYETTVDSLTDDAKIKITVRMVGEVDRSDYHCIQVYNIIVRKCFAHLKYQLVGRDFFDPHDPIVINTLNLELWPGVLSSMRQHERDILLCCEIKHKVMKKNTVLDLMDKLMRESGGDFRNKLMNEILNTVVLTEYNNRTYHIDDIDWDSTPASTFELKDKTQQSFADYYQVRYGIRIHNMRQPLLISKARARDLRAGGAEIIKLIPELCRLTGLTEKEREDRGVMSKLAEFTRPTPAKRISYLQKFNKRLQGAENCITEFKNYDLTLSKDLISLDGRVLPPEVLRYGGGTYSAGRQANWQSEMRSKALYRNVELKNWAILVAGNDKMTAQDFCRSIFRAAHGMQWRISQPVVHEIRSSDQQSYNRGLDELFARYQNIMIVLIFIPRGGDYYAFLKKKLTVEKGTLSQMVVKNTLYNQKGRMSIATKVAVQMNCKIGGAPWSVHIPVEQCMFCGFDVCHDPKNKSRSYGAFVASYDKNATAYFNTVMKHGNGEELSDFIGTSMLKALNNYKEINSCLPNKIIFYRDGVGEGQIPYVYEHELGSIKKTAEPMYAAASKKFCFRFIIVNKRINTRFFLDGGNPLPGTVVDDVVTLPTRTDFFLVPQCTHQGSVSPTYYNVLGPDEFGLDLDKTQRLTYAMCHQYFNWSGTVRVPAPCQYAHKLAFLTAQCLQRQPRENLNKSLHYL